jgi:predicted dehydrogenase
VAADLTAFVPGRQVDDNAAVLMRYPSGAKGMLWASQVSPGNENGISIRAYGDKGGLEWQQEDPNRLWFTPFGEPKQLLTRGGAGANRAANAVTRVPVGHPEGYLEAFATIYASAAQAIRAHRGGLDPAPEFLLTTLEEGVHGMAFIDACLRSSAGVAAWEPIQTLP